VLPICIGTSFSRASILAGDRPIAAFLPSRPHIILINDQFLHATQCTSYFDFPLRSFATPATTFFFSIHLPALALSFTFHFKYKSLSHLDKVNLLSNSYGVISISAHPIYSTK
jgi:hypothetical protein